MVLIVKVMQFSTDFTSPARVRIQPKINFPKSFWFTTEGIRNHVINAITHRFDHDDYKVLCKLARRNAVQCLF